MFTGRYVLSQYRLYRGGGAVAVQRRGPRR